MGTVGKKIGAMFRIIGRTAAQIWHNMTPFINRLVKALWTELGPIALEIIKQAVLEALKRGLKGEDARQVAIEYAKKGFAEHELEIRDRALNLALEIFFNKAVKTV